MRRTARGTTGRRRGPRHDRSSSVRRNRHTDRRLPSTNREAPVDVPGRVPAMCHSPRVTVGKEINANGRAYRDPTGSGLDPDDGRPDRRKTRGTWNDATELPGEDGMTDADCSKRTGYDRLMQTMSTNDRYKHLFLSEPVTCFGGQGRVRAPLQTTVANGRFDRSLQLWVPSGSKTGSTRRRAPVGSPAELRCGMAQRPGRSEIYVVIANVRYKRLYQTLRANTWFE